jgi:predicted nucleic acid-binding protein
VLDTGALIAFERNDAKVCTLVELAMAHGGALHVPAGVVGQAWRDGRQQARLARLLSSHLVLVQVLDRDEAQAAGVMCARSGTSDVIDASVALVARRHGAAVVTSDADDLRRIDSKLDVVSC